MSVTGEKEKSVSVINHPQFPSSPIIISLSNCRWYIGITGVECYNIHEDDHHGMNRSSVNSHQLKAQVAFPSRLLFTRHCGQEATK